MNKIVKSTFALMFATLLAKVFGFVREIVLANYYGTSIYSDAYLIAMNIPNIIITIVCTAIGTTFIPLFYENRDKKGETYAFDFMNNTINILTIITLILTIIGYIYAEQIVKIFAVGFEGEALNLTVEFTKVVILGTIFIILSSIMKSFLNINDNFFIPGIVTIPYNIVIIIFIVISSKYGVKYMAIGTVLGMFGQYLLSYIYAKKDGYKYKPYLNIKDESIKRMIYLLAPVMVGVGVNQINTIIDRTIASTLGEGSISALNYANRLNGFIMALIISSIASVIYPRLSQLSIKEDKSEFNNSIVKCIDNIILLILPITVGAMVLAMPIVKILFQRGQFDQSATIMTSNALIFYSIGLIGIGLRDILGKVFYSLKDTKTPMVNGVVSICLNIIMNLIVVRYMGYVGLAFATSASSILCTVLLFKSLTKKIGQFGQNKIIVVTIKCLIACIIMGLGSYFANKWITSLLIGIGAIGELISLIIAVIIGVIIYTALIINLNIEEVNEVVNSLKNRYKVYKENSV